MSKRCQSLAGATAALSVAALGSTGVLAAQDTRHPYEICLSAQALALEPSRTATSEVVAEAERACRDTKGRLSSAAVSEVTQRVRLAVMQQRANARNLERRL
jgi:hypothetical protein